MVERNFGGGTLLDKFESYDGIFSRFPTLRAPSLNNPLIGHDFDLPSRDIPPKDREGAACIAVDLRSFCSRSHRSHGCTKAHNFVELLRISERFIYSFPARLKNGLLPDRLGSTGKPGILSGPGFEWASGQAAQRSNPEEDLPPSAPASILNLLIRYHLLSPRVSPLCRNRRPPRFTP